MALPADPAGPAHTSSTANSGSCPTPEQKKRANQHIAGLISIFIVFFISAIFCSLKWEILLLAITLIGALCLAIGGGWAVIHRTKEENHVPLQNDAVNWPLAFIGLGGVLVAGAAVAPLVSAIVDSLP